MVCFSTMDDSSRRRYRNPPIEEAVCELAFAPRRTWDLTIPGKLHNELGDEYTGTPREQRIIGVGLETREGTPPHVKLGEELAKVQLVTQNGTRGIGVGQDLLSIHMLRPYHDSEISGPGGWSEFYDRIMKALKAYWKVTEPVGVTRVGIRYINIIDIPLDSGIEIYIKSAQPKVEELPEKLTNFFDRFEYIYPDDIRLILSQGFLPPSSDKSRPLLLDIDVIWGGSKPATLDSSMAKVEELHAREKRSFEAIITDKSRELFDVE